MGVWIEIENYVDGIVFWKVTPCVGVWIEIVFLKRDVWAVGSLPVWECGLKLFAENKTRSRPWSLPVWECGLKCLTYTGGATGVYVTPCVGVWIEIDYLRH